MKNVTYILKVCIISSTLLLNKNELSSQIPVSDSLALVEFYYMTNGQNWTHNDNWLTGPINTWYGIMCWGNSYINEVNLQHNNLTGPLTETLSTLQSVTGLQLYNNNLTGHIPECFGNFQFLYSMALASNHLVGPLPLSFGNNTYLSDLYIDTNDFEGPFPDTILKRNNPFTISFSENNFSSLPYYPAFSAIIDARGNNLSFKDIVPYCLNSSLVLFRYAPQDSILNSIDTTVLAGSSISFSSWIDTCHNNRYRWKKDNIFISPLDTNSVLTLNNLQHSDSGNYTCYVVNSDAPLLTLYRRVIHLHIIDSVVGITDTQEDTEYTLLFNETDWSLRILLNLKSPQYLTCYLYDIMGRKVLRLFEGKTQNQELHYYLNEVNIKPGLYIVRLKLGEQILSRKVIVR